MIVYGLDLMAIRPSVFKPSNMFNKMYYLRNERIIVYQLAMLFSILNQSFTESTLEKYLKMKRAVAQFQPGATYHVNDIVGVASFTLFSGIYVSVLLFFMFLILLFWPEIPETRIWSRIKCAAFVFGDILMFAATLSSTVVIAIGHGYLKPSHHGSSAALSAHFANPNPPYYYRQNSYCIIWIVFMWIDLVPLVVATYYVIKASNYHLANPHIIATYEKATSNIELRPTEDSV